MQMSEKIAALFVLSALSLLSTVTGCTGPVGPQGEDGAQGAAGKDGAKGAAGKEGERGATGARGEEGPAGAAGAGASIASGMTCVSSFGTGYVVTFEMAKMTSGDVFSSAAIQGTNAVRSSGSGFWPAEHANTARAPVIVLADGYGAENQGFFVVSFNPPSGSMRVVADDPDLPGSEMTYDFPTTACKAY